MRNFLLYTVVSLFFVGCAFVGCSKYSQQNKSVVNDTIRVVQTQIDTLSISIVDKGSKYREECVLAGASAPEETVIERSSSGGSCVKKSVIRRSVTVQETSGAKAKLSYSFPDTMRVDNVSRVALMISKTELSDDNIIMETKRLVSKDGASKVTTCLTTIKIGEKMTASLIDATKSFDITPIGVTTQSIDFKEENSYIWQWDVVPVKGGKKELSISVVIIRESGQTNVPVFSKDIFVMVNKKVIILSFLDFLKEYWIVFSGIGAAIVTVVGWFINKKKKKK